MKFFEICAEVLVPKYTRAEVRLPARDPGSISNSSPCSNDDRLSRRLILSRFKNELRPGILIRKATRKVQESRDKDFLVEVCIFGQRLYFLRRC